MRHSSSSCIHYSDDIFAIRQQCLKVFRHLLRQFTRGHENQCPRNLLSIFLHIFNESATRNYCGLTAFALSNFCMIGIQYAAVFPLPVRARARISWPSSARGIVLAWTGVGFTMPISARARSMRLSTRLENAENVVAPDISSLALLEFSQSRRALDTNLVGLQNILPLTWVASTSLTTSGWSSGTLSSESLIRRQRAKSVCCARWYSLLPVQSLISSQLQETSLEISLPDLQCSILFYDMFPASGT